MGSGNSSFTPTSVYHRQGGRIISKFCPMLEVSCARGRRVILDADLAELYEVKTKVLNQAVKRNSDRFPEDFMFQLSKEEFENLRSQTVTSSWGGRRYAPYAFTEQGIYFVERDSIF